jgi:hypothetical protein
MITTETVPLNLTVDVFAEEIRANQRVEFIDRDKVIPAEFLPLLNLGKFAKRYGPFRHIEHPRRGHMTS